VNPLEIGPYGPFGQPKWAHFSISLVNNIAMPKGMRAQITKKKPYSLFSRAKEHKHNSVRVIKSNQPSAVKKKKKKKKKKKLKKGKGELIRIIIVKRSYYSIYF
jgi:hypothetical protein